MDKLRLFTLLSFLTLVLALSGSTVLAYRETPQPPAYNSDTPFQDPSPDIPESAYRLAHQNGDEAVVAADQLPAGDPKKQELLQEAVQWYSEALAESADADKTLLYNARGVTYFRLDEYELAIADYNAALEPGPQAFFLKNRGLAYEEMGDLEKALVDFEFYVDWLGNISSREEEYNYFTQKVAELRRKVEIEYTSPFTSVSEDKGFVPLWWAWADY